MTPLAAVWPARVYFARHGRTGMNIRGLVQGSIDPPLHRLGRADAERVALHLAGRAVGRVLSSPMRRAVATAGIVAGRLGVPVVIVPDLAERRWGRYEGRPGAERPPLADPPGAETRRAVGARVAGALRGAQARGHLSEGTLILAHAGVFRAILSALGMPGDAAVDHGEVFEIAVAAGEPELRRLSLGCRETARAAGG